MHEQTPDQISPPTYFRLIVLFALLHRGMTVLFQLYASVQYSYIALRGVICIAVGIITSPSLSLEHTSSGGNCPQPPAAGAAFPPNAHHPM
jgi:hypothetical protein